MTPKPSRRASCEGKVPFPSRRLAAESLKRTERVRDFIGKDRERFEVYACRYCGQFHLGRKNERSVDMATKEFKRDPFAKRKKPCKSEAVLRAWSATRTFCYCCGDVAGLFPLETHHIVKQGRAHEATNFLRLCRRCHQLAEGLDIRGPSWTHRTEGRIKGELLPKLTIGMCLTLKQIHDPEEYDEDRLQELRGSRLPDPEPVPDYFTRLFARNRGAA